MCLPVAMNLWMSHDPNSPRQQNKHACQRSRHTLDIHITPTLQSTPAAAMRFCARHSTTVFDTHTPPNVHPPRLRLAAPPPPRPPAAGAAARAAGPGPWELGAPSAATRRRRGGNPRNIWRIYSAHRLVTIRIDCHILTLYAASVRNLGFFCKKRYLPLLY